MSGFMYGFMSIFLFIYPHNLAWLEVFIQRLLTAWKPALKPSFQVNIVGVGVGIGKYRDSVGDIAVTA